MSHHYKRYSIDQLKEEEESLKKQLREAETLNQRNYIAVYKRKIEIVQSYMLDQNQFQPGDVRELKEDQSLFFEIDEMSGVIAWGYRMNKHTQEKIDNEPVAKLLILLGEKL